jgi:hypothetical protein
MKLIMKLALIILLFTTFLAVSLSSACTLFSVSYGQKVFFAGNEDKKPISSFIVLDKRGTFGVVYIGTPREEFPVFMNSGINEKGLSFDLAWIGKEKLNSHPERKSFKKPDGWPPIELLREASTVEEVLSKIFTYNWGDAISHQIHFADKNGDAVVIYPGKDGELTYTRKPKGNSYLVSSNFNLGRVNDGNFITHFFRIGWDRYKTADQMLSKIRAENDLTIEYLTSILDATSQNNWIAETIHSTIYDLQNLRIYLYTERQFGSPYVLDVAGELDKTTEYRKISFKELLDK